MKKLFLLGLIMLTPTLLQAEWVFSTPSFTIKDKLSITQEYELYTGDTAIQENEKTPTTGFKFVLAEIIAKNQNPETPKLVSENIRLKTNKGIYSRLTEDHFLMDFNIKPFTHLNLKKGTHTGTLLFEVPKDQITDDLKLIYENKIIQ